MRYPDRDWKIKIRTAGDESEYYSGSRRHTETCETRGSRKSKRTDLHGQDHHCREAKLIGLVNQVTGDTREELMEAAKAMAEQIMKKGPVATRLAKMAINVGMDTDINTGLLFERIAQTVAFGTEDRKEGTQAFLEKRKAEFKGC